MKLLIRNGMIVDPAQGIEEIGNILVENRRILRISLSGGASAGIVPQDLTDCRTIDASGLHVIPGLVDMHVHLREPGYEYKETIRTGTLAAVRGGFTSVCCMPNTKPVNDNETVTEFILRKAYAEGACFVFPVGAITKGQQGEELAEMGMMREAGCVAFSDDGQSVMSSLVMRRALEYSKAFGVPMISHAEDMDLSAGGVMNEGRLSSSLGLKGVPAEAEIIHIKRDVELAALTRGRLHIAHVSTAGGVRAIREAKERGLAVTAETCPHYFSLTEDAVQGYNAFAKVNPPLRSDEDREEIIKGLADGTIDVIASDHAPHHRDEKLCEFDNATSGISGLETAFALSLRLVNKGVLSLSQMVEKMSLNPSRVLGIEKGSLREGADADLLIADMKGRFTVVPEEFASKGKNTPFAGWDLRGSVRAVVVRGVVHEFS